MLQIGNTIVSLDLLEKKFVCDLDCCKGICCIEGDSGAPLEYEELTILEEIFPIVEPYLNEKGKAEIAQHGKYVIDKDGDVVTPVVDENRECAYTIFENGIAFCAIEKAFLDKKITFRKPISCHLYPIKINKYNRFDGVNYHQQEICRAARKYGEKLNVPVYQFSKDVLIRKYGEAWFEELDFVAKQYFEGK